MGCLLVFEPVKRCIDAVWLVKRAAPLMGMLAATVAACSISAAQGPPPEVRQQLRERESHQHELSLKRRQDLEAARGGLTARERAELSRLHATERRRYELREREDPRQQAGTAGVRKTLPEADAQMREKLSERHAAERRDQDKWRLEQDSRRLLDSVEQRTEGQEAAPAGDWPKVPGRLPNASGK